MVTADLLADPRHCDSGNLDTDLLPPAAGGGCQQTRAIHEDDASSYLLPFFGHDAAGHRDGGAPGGAPSRLDCRQCFISAGGLGGIFNTLLACIDPTAVTKIDSRYEA